MSYQDKKNQVKGLLKETPATPLQKIQPIKEEKKYHINFWIDPTLEMKLKRYALESGKSIKEVGIEALEFYLSEKLERSEAK